MPSTTSDPFLLLALRVGLVSFALTLALALVVVWLRISLGRRKARWESMLASWRPVLLAAIVGPGQPAQLPRLHHRDRQLFLKLWAYLHESVRGAGAARLNDVATALDMRSTATDLLIRGGRAEQLLAIHALGYLGDRQAWQLLLRLAAGADSLIAVNAARALMRIEPFDAASQLMPLILGRRDWDITRVAAFLGEARDAFWLLLLKALPAMKPEDVPQALKLALTLRLTLPPQVLRRLLEQTQPVDTVCAALRLAGDPELAQDVRRCLSHESWRVREQAVSQMGRLAQPNDVAGVAALLEDSEWPVRLAAGQALAKLPFLEPGALEELARRGPGAQQILGHVIAERTLS